MQEKCLDERTRAEDVILGSLGFGEDAKLVTVIRTTLGFRGTGRYADGEIFEFESEDEVDEIQEWALRILTK